MRPAIVFSAASGAFLAAESVIQESTLIPMSLLLVLLSGIVWLVWQAARTLDRIEGRLKRGDERFEQVEAKLEKLPCVKHPTCQRDKHP